MLNLIKRLAIAMAVFGAFYLVGSQVPFFKDFDITINSWAWALYLPLVIASVFVQGFIGGFAKGILDDTSMAPTPVVAKFVDEFSDWPCMAVAFLVTTYFMPAYASCTSVVVLLVLSGVVGLASAVSDYLCDKFVPRKPKSE